MDQTPSYILFLLEHYDLIFLYGLKYLKDIKESLSSHDTRITEIELRDKIKKEYNIT